MPQEYKFADLKKEQPIKIKTIKINDKDIEIKQYLPVNEKLELITNVLKDVVNGNDYNFINPIQMDVYTSLEIVSYYAPSIIFSDAERADAAALYDELEKYNIINMVVNAIPKEEYNFLIDGITKSVQAYYDSRNSIKGILEDVITDYSKLDLDASKIQKELADPENMKLLKDVMTKLG